MANYVLNVSLVESASSQPSSKITDYTANNNNNIDNVGNYTVDGVLQANDYVEPNNQSGEDVVPF